MSSDSRIRKIANGFMITCMSLIIILLLWNASLNIANFAEQQQELAKRSVAAAANEIELLVKGYKRSINIFADENNKLIGNAASTSGGTRGHTALKEKITRFFPEYFSFTITDDFGLPLLEEHEGIVGTRCRSDIESFTTGNGDYLVTGHRGPDDTSSHFDVMSHWGNSDSLENIFFISFRNVNLERILEHTQVAGHHILLLSDDDPAQVVVTTSGNRTLFPQYETLSSHYTEQVSHSRPIPGTHWSAVILPEKSLYRDNYFSILRQSLLVLLGVLVISVITRMMLLDELKNRD